MLDDCGFCAMIFLLILNRDMETRARSSGRLYSVADANVDNRFYWCFTAREVAGDRPPFNIVPGQSDLQLRRELPGSDEGALGCPWQRWPPFPGSGNIRFKLLNKSAFVGFDGDYYRLMFSHCCFCSWSRRRALLQKLPVMIWSAWLNSTARWFAPSISTWMSQVSSMAS